MTITLKARTAAAVLALLCILAGLAIGQLTQAKSAGGSLYGVERELKKLNSRVGLSYSSGSVNGLLKEIETDLGHIEDSSSATCRAVGGNFC
jgi:hypothetical protein